MAEVAQGVAGIVVADLVGKLGPGEFPHLQHVVQELHQLEGAGAEVAQGLRLRDGRHMLPDLLDAAPGGRHHIVEAGEVPQEQ